VDTTTGLVSGIPTRQGKFTVTLSATNAFGTGSQPLILTINSPLPGVTTKAARSVTSSSAEFHALVNPRGLPTTAYFEFGETSAFGAATGVQTLATSTSPLPILEAVSALTPNTTYHYRVVATNSSGTAFSQDRTFTTPYDKAAPNLPEPGAELLPEASWKDRSSPSDLASGTRNPRKKGRSFRISGLFLLAVLIPTVLAAIYYGFIASDIYISESHFVVRTATQQSSSSSAGGLGALLGASGSSSLANIYSVQDYMLSKDALVKLDAEFALARKFGSRDVDLLSRFAGIAFWDRSFEALHEYYQKRVTLTVDNMTSVAVLDVSTFNPDDCFRINEMLLKMGESLVNQLNARAQKDMVRFAASEVDVALTKSKAATQALADYRSAHSLVDPPAETAIQLQSISKLQDELIATRALLAQAQAFSPDSPQIRLLQSRIAGLVAEMSAQVAKLTSTDKSSLVSVSSEYERLSLERTFANNQLVTALTGLEQARIDAIRQNLYLARIVEPGKPSIAVEPRRVRSVLTTFLFGMLAWGILSLLVAGVREHAE